MINEAIEFAAKAHEGQLRKGTKKPYIVHPIEVSEIVSAMTDDEEVICAAVLQTLRHQDKNVSGTNPLCPSLPEAIAPDNPPQFLLFHQTPLPPAVPHKPLLLPCLSDTTLPHLYKWKSLLPKSGLPSQESNPIHDASLFRLHAQAKSVCFR